MSTNRAARLMRIINSAQDVPTQQARKEHLNRKYMEMDAAIHEACRPGRDLNQALTKLDETLMWAYAALAGDEPETEGETRLRRPPGGAS